MLSVATRVSPEEYLERERQAETRSEYRDGVIVAMSGASLRHGRMVRNLISLLDRRLAEGPCEVFATDLRLRVRAANLYTYPAVMVICGEPESADERQDVVLNPVVIIEVLSKSTEKYDRGEKFANYRMIPSLKEYLMATQDRVLVEQHTKQSDGEWTRTEHSDASGLIRLESIGVELAVADIYRKVKL
jgi:Uma2 family endonuclease